ncbi:MAG: aminotransferase class III-fold pyridoxal phosphate-dependent enzyme [Actinobacteria bacterium]|nr:aminotransferase class III-fold pyridoxal phosphate-dependent enzyme [Actinomycetota bacterium]
MQSLLASARQVLAGGALGFFRLPPEVDAVIASGQGAHVWDVSGKEYIDYILGSGPMLVGHVHPAVVAAVRAQAGRGSSYFILNEPAIRLAERLVAAVPCAERVRFQGSGTEATYYALRAARAHTGRSKILKFEGGWHGMHDYAVWGTVPSQPSDYPRALPDSTGVPPCLADEVLVAPFNDPDRACDIIRRSADTLAAVIVEPLQRVLVPQPGFLEAIREVTQRYGIVLVFDEIVTGFRLAWGGAQERYGVVPDVATYGKAIGGGYPISAIVGRADIMAAFGDALQPQPAVAWASGTFNGNPVAAAAGLAALDVMSQPGMFERLHATGSRLRRGIEEAGRRRGFAARALGEDAVFGVRFIAEGPVTSWADLLRHDRDLGQRWGAECIKRGLLAVPNEKFYVSIAHTQADVERTLEICDDAFKACVA